MSRSIVRTRSPSLFSDDVRKPRALLAIVSALLLTACPPPPVVDEDAGETGNVDDAGGGIVGDAGVDDAGPSDAGSTTDAGTTTDAGSNVDAGSTDAGLISDAGSTDAGPGFTWSDVFGDAGIPEELECIPEQIPELSLAGALDYLSFTLYTGSSENGVRCGDQICDDDTPCCALCGYSVCADPGTDGGPSTCPFYTRSYACDGKEDCTGNGDVDTCCYTLDGTTCRTTEECTFELPSFGGDGGFNFPWPPQSDGGFVVDDAGSAQLDGGLPDGGASDAGVIDVDAGPSPLESFIDLLDQGLPVCRNLLDCGIFSGDLCCTSDRIVELDLGVCISALACLGGALE
jgi:hypothetical protein